MEKTTKREKSILIAFAALVIFAWLCRVFDIPREGGGNSIRAVIYPSLIICWAFTLHHRLIHRQVRHLAIGIAAMLLLWFMLRTIKYCLGGQPSDLARHLWYMYYLPMIFTPTMALFMALSVGMPETQRLPRRYNILWFIALAVFLLVLTNDLHQLAFSFPDNGTVWSDDDYSYAVGYYAYIVWLAVCIPATQVILVMKSRHPESHSRGLLPSIPLLLLMVYLIIYAVTGSKGWIKILFGDMTAVSCVLYMLTFELCIRCGLIRSNTGYEELFQASRLGAQITDHTNTICLSSEYAGAFSQEQIISARNRPVLVDKSTLLESKQIHFGHVLWQKDISELAESIRQIEENMQELEEQSRIRRKKMEAQHMLLTLQEQNKIVDLLHRETAGQIELIDRLLGAYDQEQDETERHRLLAGAAVVGAYIKRYGNLLLVSEREDTADIADLTRCFEESFIHLEMMNVDCHASLPTDIVLYTTDMLRIYRTFEEILEDGLFELHHVWVHGREREGRIRIAMEFVSDADLAGHAAEADIYSGDSDACRFTFDLQRGGRT